MTAANDTVRALRDYLATRLSPDMTESQLDEMAAELAVIAQTQQHPLTLNGHQLLDALNSIAPQRSAPQLATTVCISKEPTGTNGYRVPPKLYCWLATYPKAGSIQLFDNGDQPQRATQDVVYMATKLIECARWVYATPDARKQPHARRLAKVILRLACPLISAHADTAQRTS